MDTSKWVYPFKTRFGVSSGYGNRTYELNGKLITDFHKGIDFLTPIGTEIVMMFDGYLDIYKDSADTLYLVMIENGTNNRVDILHVKDVINPRRQAKQGEVVGYSGNTGKNTTGPHSHIEIRPNWEQNRNNYINPAFVADLPLFISNKTMNEINIIDAVKNQDLGDVLRRAGVENPGSDGQKQNVANLNKKWLDKNGNIKQHNGSWQDLNHKLEKGDLIRVRGTPESNTINNDKDIQIQQLKSEKQALEVRMNNYKSLTEDQSKLLKKAHEDVDALTNRLNDIEKEFTDLNEKITIQAEDINALNLLVTNQQSELNGFKTSVFYLLYKLFNGKFSRKSSTT